MTTSQYMEDRMEQARREVGKWMATSIGWIWFLNDPDPRDVSIIDIAVGLSRQSRYGGQFGVDVNGYSVSEHSRKMDEFLARNVPKRMRDMGQKMMLEDRIEILLHDAPEHLFGDMITPVKAQFPNYKVFENMHHQTVRSSFIRNLEGISIRPKEIKEIDIRIRADEREAIILDPAKTLGRERFEWVDDKDGEVVPLGVTIEGNMSPFECRIFLETFVEVVETVPARLPENGPEQNTSLRRHYVDACTHLGLEPLFHPETGRRTLESRDTAAIQEAEDRRAEDFASRVMSQVRGLGPETMLALKAMIEADLEKSNDLSDYEPAA